MTLPMNKLYRTNQEEQARQGFVGALKTFVNGELEREVVRRYHEELAPAYRAKQGHDATTRYEAIPVLEPDPDYQLWCSTVYSSQDLLWETTGETVDRLLPEFDKRAAEIEANPARLGSLQLDPKLELPTPIAHTEIHRQPGGYFYRQSQADLSAALLYMGSVEIYRTAKGFGAPGEPCDTSSGKGLARIVAEKYPDLEPRRVLDMGCGVGAMAMGLKQALPQAEVHGLDLSAPFVRFAHLWANDLGLELHMRQADAANTGYDDAGFDLIVSQILFHETWHDKLPAIMREAHRLLRPGGVFFNIDTPYQPDRIGIPEQVLNNWQVANNGEPFWVGFSETSVKTELERAGFAAADIFADYQPMGGGREFFMFGARKTDQTSA